MKTYPIFLEQLPEPGRAWIRFRPKDLPFTSRCWCDVSAARLRFPMPSNEPGLPTSRIDAGEVFRASASGEAATEGDETPPPAARSPVHGEPDPRVGLLSGATGEFLSNSPWRQDDVLYLPPGSNEDSGWRVTMAALREAMGPIVVQRFPDETPIGIGRLELVDYTDHLLGAARAAPETLEDRVDGTWAVMPLLAGMGGPAAVESVLERHARGGGRGALLVPVQSDGVDRRRLAEHLGGDRRFEEIFHGARPDEQMLRAIAHRLGLGTIPPRPLPVGPPRLRHQRELAALLQVVAELCSRAGQPEGLTHGFFADARIVERSTADVWAMVQEGNVRLLPDLSSGAARLLTRWVVERNCEFLDRDTPTEGWAATNGGTIVC